VSKDLQATLITVDFIDREVDYQVFEEIGALVKKVENDRVGVRVVGAPILYGWVEHYLPETLELVAIALALTLAMLFLLLRTWRGVFLPLLAWRGQRHLGAGHLQSAGHPLRALVIVVAMLITSRAVSHSVQIVNRFDDELEHIADGSGNLASGAHIALVDLFRRHGGGGCRRRAWRW
jgi:predicted RND superfamily exporter protein